MARTETGPQQYVPVWDKGRSGRSYTEGDTRALHDCPTCSRRSQGPDNSLTREVFPRMHLGLALKSELGLLLAV